MPIYEPGLDKVVKACRGGNSLFSTIFASVNTPTKIKGVGAGCAANLRYIESVGRTVAQYANRPRIIIEKSTVPVKTAACSAMDYMIPDIEDSVSSTSSLL